MSHWIYDLIYESGGQHDSGYVQVGDLVLYSGGYVGIAGVVFPPGAEIDLEYGAIHLKREPGSSLLQAFAGSEHHVFEYRRVPLWCSRWYRYTPVCVSSAGEIDASEMPSLPLGVRVKEWVATTIVAVVIAQMLWFLVQDAWFPSP